MFLARKNIAALAAVLRDIKGWLYSEPDRYHELSDSYDAEYFRYGVISGSLDIEEQLNKVGSFTVTFNCKPYKYSFAGQEMVSADDSTLTVNENPQAELDLLNDDRVEIFFSADSAMTCYYGAEMTPAGHTLDYKAKFYRDIDYAWNFSTLKLECEHTDMHYTMSGSIDLQELESMGLNLKEGFYMGVFRADYRSDGSANWDSAVKSDDVSPDFHKPDMLFKAVIR